MLSLRAPPSCLTLGRRYISPALLFNLLTFSRAEVSRSGWVFSVAFFFFAFEEPLNIFVGSQYPIRPQSIPMVQNIRSVTRVNHVAV